VATVRFIDGPWDGQEREISRIPTDRRLRFHALAFDPFFPDDWDKPLTPEQSVPVPFVTYEIQRRDDQFVGVVAGGLNRGDR